VIICIDVAEVKKNPEHPPVSVPEQDEAGTSEGKRKLVKVFYLV
jgi:hypothetical protein